MLRSEDLRAIEQTLGYTFRDRSLLIQAFTRTSYCNEHIEEGYESNEVLEFFGDSVLSLVLVTVFIRDYTSRYAHGMRTEFSEGDLSVIKSNLTDKRNLSRSMHELGLSRYLIMGEGDKKEGVMREASVLEDLYESILGAIYIDSGHDMEAVIGVVERTLDTSIFLERHAPVKNYKGLLQEYCQDRRRRLGAPLYQTKAKEGRDDQPIHERTVSVGGEVLGVGRARSTKEADNLAAKMALDALETRESRGQRESARPDHTFAYRLHLYVRQDAALPELIDCGATEHPDSTPQSPRYRYAYRIGECIFEGDATSKNEAKQSAAEKALKWLDK